MSRRLRPVPAIAAVTLVAASLTSACGPGDSSDDGAAVLVPGGFSQAAGMAFDSASAALEAGDALRARELFSAVLDEDSTLAAAWIGLHLADRALNERAAADSALRQARALIEPPRLRGGPAKPVT